MAALIVVAVAGICAAFVAGRPGAGHWLQWVSTPLRWLAALGTLAAAIWFGLTLARWFGPGATVNTDDFAAFYSAGQAARAQASLYDLGGIRQDPGTILVYRHAPIGATLLAPLTWLPPHSALNLWRLGQIGLYLGVCAFLLWHYRLSPREPLAFGLATLWLIAAPSRESLASGQWDTMFLVGTTLALVLLARRRDSWAGACLALPVALKFYPALVLLAPLLARRWRVVAGCALAFVALTALGLLVAGWQNTAVFFSQVVFAVGGGTVYAENQTLYASIGRLLATDLRDRGLNAQYPTALTSGLALALGALLLAVTALVVLRRPATQPIADLQFTLPVVVALLVIPTAWLHYELWALLPLFVLGLALARLHLPWPLYLTTLAAALLVTVGTERDVWGPGPHAGPARLVLSYKVYGLLLLWGSAAYVIWRHSVWPARRI